MPIAAASNIIPYSKIGLSIIFIPNMGKLLTISGSTAQCMAQATEAVTPKASQLILKAMYKIEERNYINYAT